MVKKFKKATHIFVVIIGIFTVIAVFSARILKSAFKLIKYNQRLTPVDQTVSLNQGLLANSGTGVNSDINAVVYPAKEVKLVSIIQDQDISQAVRQAVDQVGGIRLSKPESVVLIKPNVNSNGKFPATTNPIVVETLIKLAYRAGAKRVVVADSSGVGWPDTLKNMTRTGLKQIAEKAGAEVVDLETHGWRKIKPVGAEFWPNGFRLSTIIDEVDYIISVPIIKTHTTTGITLGLKNSVGLLHRDDRLAMHKSNKISEMIAEINLAFKPDLIVFDGSKSFITKGPDIGQEVAGNYIIASQEILTADTVAYKVLKKLGAKLNDDPIKHPMLGHARRLNFPYQEVKI